MSANSLLVTSYPFFHWERKLNNFLYSLLVLLGFNKVLFLVLKRWESSWVARMLICLLVSWKSSVFKYKVGRNLFDTVVFFIILVLITMGNPSCDSRLEGNLVKENMGSKMLHFSTSMGYFIFVPQVLRQLHMLLRVWLGAAHQCCHFLPLFKGDNGALGSACDWFLLVKLNIIKEPHGSALCD